LLAPSPDRALLIAAVSGRALAAAARRAGYRPLVADLFRDDDTVALAGRAVRLPGSLRGGIDPERVVPTLEALAEGEAPVAAICGSGFERLPETIDAIARTFPLAGNRGTAIRRVKNPKDLAVDCAVLGIDHPEFGYEPPADPENWVVKTAGAAGGQHVKKGSKETSIPSRYFQRFVDGDSVSALFVADGRTARIVGFSRQWTSPAGTTPYRYGGAVRLRRVERARTERIGGWLSALTARIGLVGLNGADFIVSGNRSTLIEINPRPGATLDIFDSSDAPLIEAHLRASRGEPYNLPRFAQSMASMIAYAGRPVENFPALDWPDWTADRQSAGTSLAPGDPVCTVFAGGRTARATQAAVRRNARLLHRALEEAEP
jgi:uncharacterized protein